MAIFGSQLYKRRRIGTVELLSVSFILYVMVNMCCTALVNGAMSSVAFDTFLEFGVKAIPAILIALVVARKKLLLCMINIVDFFTVAAALGFIRILIGIMFYDVSRGMLFTEFGVDYQQISYYAAYFFALDLFMLFVGNKYVTGVYRSKKKFQAIRFCVAVVSFATSAYSGGRGGFVLTLFVLFMWFFLYLIKKRKIKQFLVGVLLLLGGGTIMLSVIRNNETMRRSIERIFEFVGSNGINWEGTSGRGEIYERAIALVTDSVAFGYGITGGSYHGVISSHNLFLEILVESGILGLIFCLIILTFFLARLRKKIIMDEAYLLILTIFLCDFIGLMFSFIHWRCTAIWFAIFLILNDKEVSGNEKKSRNVELS